MYNTVNWLLSPEKLCLLITVIGHANFSKLCDKQLDVTITVKLWDLDMVLPLQVYDRHYQLLYDVALSLCLYVSRCYSVSHTHPAAHLTEPDTLMVCSWPHSIPPLPPMLRISYSPQPNRSKQAILTLLPSLLS
mgnify:FL=1